MRRRAAGGLILSLAISACVVGCSPSTASTPESPSISLSGPWASEFETAFSNAGSDHERAVLRDGTVTSVEYEQTKSSLRSCLADSGYTIDWDERGGFELGSSTSDYPDDFFERSDPILQECEKRWSGSIMFLFEQTRRNPQKKDEATIQTACLKAAGLVDETYSKRRWKHDNETGILPYDSMSEEALRCATDPLALWLTK